MTPVITIMLEHPVAIGPLVFREATVRIPDPGIDLMRPPAGMSKAEWRVRTLTDLPPTVADQLSVVDFGTIADALEILMDARHANA